jgi:hypothetical protein
MKIDGGKWQTNNSQKKSARLADEKTERDREETDKR